MKFEIEWEGKGLLQPYTLALVSARAHERFALQLIYALAYRPDGKRIAWRSWGEAMTDETARLIGTPHYVARPPHLPLHRFIQARDFLAPVQDSLRSSLYHEDLERWFAHVVEPLENFGANIDADRRWAPVQRFHLKRKTSQRIEEANAYFAERGVR